jgi:diaminopimelate epimerase
LNFTKLHGAGNDYLYVDARNQERDWPALSVAMSDRHTGAGSDGIILVLPSDKANLRMRMFNADGSESEMCGNGIRCFVRFALDEQIIPYGDSAVSVETGAGVLNVTPILKNGEMVRARVSMGEPVLIPSACASSRASLAAPLARRIAMAQAAREATRGSRAARCSPPASREPLRHPRRSGCEGSFP